MLGKNTLIALLASASLVVPSTYALAQPGKDKNPGRGNSAGAQEKKAKHKHAQKNGRMALGAKLKQNGKHAVGKFANRDVVADVRNGKVANMAAGDLPVKRVKTRTKMAMINNPIVPVAWNPLQLAQYGYEDVYYYGYCFDDGFEFTCYWFAPEEVEYTAWTWEEYDPYY